MKANEFVKLVGFKEAKRYIDDGFNEMSIHLPGDALEKPSVINMDDLKRIAESHELVEAEGGIDAAKEKLKYFINWLAEDLTHAEFAPEIGKFKQAIADVESCQ